MATREVFKTAKNKKIKQKKGGEALADWLW